MAITYRLNDHRISFHWDKENDLWKAECEDLNGLHLHAKNFNSMLKMLNKQYPELAHSIGIFFPDSIKEVAEIHYPNAFETNHTSCITLESSKLSNAEI